MTNGERLSEEDKVEKSREEISKHMFMWDYVPKTLEPQCVVYG